MDAPTLVFACAVNLALGALFLRLGKVTRSGAVAGFVVGVTAWIGAGWRAYLLLLFFFLAGTIATRIGREVKRARRVAQQKGGARSYANVLANGGFAALWSILYGTSGAEGYLLFLAASLAAATADTLESEIGMLSKQEPRLLLVGRPVPVGTDGGISPLGLTAGVIGSASTAGLACATGFLEWNTFAMIAAAGFLATIVESAAGAVFHTRGEPAGHLLNLLNTGLPALFVWIGFAAGA